MIGNLNRSRWLTLTSMKIHAPMIRAFNNGPKWNPNNAFDAPDIMGDSTQSVINQATNKYKPWKA